MGRTDARIRSGMPIAEPEVIERLRRLGYVE
jgi:hypothetical protein